MKDQRYTTFEHPVESNPLFEAKIQTIVNRKKGKPVSSSENDDDDDDEWDSVDEDEEYLDQDLDDFIDKTVQDNEEEGSQGGSDRKKKKTEDNAADIVAQRDDEKSMKREKKREMDRVYKEITALPPPGCLNPKEIVDSDLYEVLSLTESNALRSIVVSIFTPDHTVRSYCSHRTVTHPFAHTLRLQSRTKTTRRFRRPSRSTIPLSDLTSLTACSSTFNKFLVCGKWTNSHHLLSNAQMNARATLYILGGKR